LGCFHVVGLASQTASLTDQLDGDRTRHPWPSLHGSTPAEALCDRHGFVFVSPPARTDRHSRMLGGVGGQQLEGSQRVRAHSQDPRVREGGRLVKLTSYSTTMSSVACAPMLIPQPLAATSAGVSM
jgi:hypothetical protein